jgi:hypothetical protein
MRNMRLVGGFSEQYTILTDEYSTLRYYIDITAVVGAIRILIFY